MRKNHSLWCEEMDPIPWRKQKTWLLRGELKGKEEFKQCKEHQIREVVSHWVSGHKQDRSHPSWNNSGKSLQLPDFLNSWKHLVAELGRGRRVTELKSVCACSSLSSSTYHLWGGSAGDCQRADYGLIQNLTPCLKPFSGSLPQGQLQGLGPVQSHRSLA